MGSRDHSIECEVCGEYRGGLNDLRCDCDPCEVCGEKGTEETPCRCDRQYLAGIHLDCLAANLVWGAMLCRAFDDGIEEAEQHRLYHRFEYRTAECWIPGCGKEAP